MKNSQKSHPDVRERIWDVMDSQGDPACQQDIARLSETLSVSLVTARLLWNRGFHTPESALDFIRNDESVWHDPMLMKDMDRAVDRVLAAVEGHERIAIYGDYDVDGVTSVSVLYLYLTGLGAEVVRYIPNRMTEGYGMSKPAVKRLSEEGVDLIITVDTGITARAEVAYAASLGMDTVVTDHHECCGDLPDCDAVINPHRPDCPYPFKELAGVGVAFKLVCACEAVRSGLSVFDAFHAMSAELIDLVAIGTVADVMLLVDENRFIVTAGIAILNDHPRCGLAALLDAVSNSTQSRPAGGGSRYRKPRRKVNSGLIGFTIAPRINAAGRISDAMKAVDLILATEPERAAELAADLCEINTTRQSEENRIAEQAYGRIEEEFAALPEDAPRNRVLVLDDDEWMQGIIGIVSSRITEKYGLPSILISFDGAIAGYPSELDNGKGSGRSVKGFNLTEALTYCEDLLVRYGGHELAAGLTIRRADIPEFRQRLNEYAAAHLTDDMTAVRYEAECEVNMADLTLEQAKELDRLEPYGVGNATPVFYMRDMTVQNIVALKGGKHTKLMLYRDGAMVQALWFNMPTSRLPVMVGDRADVLFQLSVNDFQGVQSVQMVIQDLRIADSYVKACAAERERLSEILDGAPIDPSEQVVPTRDDVACVFTLLRRDARLGNNTISEHDLLSRLSDFTERPMGYIKTRLILQILDEMQVCRILEPDHGIFIFEINQNAAKTSIDASPLMQSLRRQTTEPTDSTEKTV